MFAKSFPFYVVNFISTVHKFKKIYTNTYLLFKPLPFLSFLRAGLRDQSSFVGSFVIVIVIVILILPIQGVSCNGFLFPLVLFLLFQLNKESFEKKSSFLGCWIMMTYLFRGELLPQYTLWLVRVERIFRIINNI